MIIHPLVPSFEQGEVQSPVKGMKYIACMRPCWIKCWFRLHPEIWLMVTSLLLYSFRDLMWKYVLLTEQWGGLKPFRLVMTLLTAAGENTGSVALLFVPLRFSIRSLFLISAAGDSSVEGFIFLIGSDWCLSYVLWRPAAEQVFRAGGGDQRGGRAPHLSRLLLRDASQTMTQSLSVAYFQPRLVRNCVK